MLQLDWSMVRLRPNSVSSGCTDTQFDFTPQSPQPSQTSSLMTTRLSGSGILAALAAAALLGGAGLVVDQHGAAGHLRQLLLHLLQIVAVMDRHAGRPLGPGGIFPRLVGDDDDALRALGRHLAGDLRHRDVAVIVLAAGHGDGVVEQDLVGDVDAGLDGGADRERARMIVGAVAEILEHVGARGERRLADPVGALGAHLGVARASSGPSTGPCNGSRCRHRRGCLRAPPSRNCAGSPSRNTECAPRRPRSRRGRAAPPSAAPPRARELVVARRN